MFFSAGIVTKNFDTNLNADQITYENLLVKYLVTNFIFKNKFKKENYPS